MADSNPDEAEDGTEAQPTLPHVDMTPTSEADSVEEPRGDVYRVELDVFEGPLDLLLHLIRKHELDILDIPVAFITEKYLAYLTLMTEVQIDVASEYLVMAATLIHIKSKMLLPPDPNRAEDEEGEGEIDEDPRADLVRRLLEYQKYKHVAAQLGGRSQLGRDVFTRGSDEPTPEGPAALAPVSVFRLFDAFERVLKRARQTADHEISFERLSLTERIVELTELLSDRGRLRFDELFSFSEAQATRLEVVITFLALLEMCKMRVARVLQDDPLGDIFVELAPKHLTPEPSSA